MNKTVTYKEPKDYFTSGMLKVAKEFDQKNSGKTGSKPAPAKKGKK